MATVAALMVSVDVPLPPVTVVGDMPQVVAPSEEDTLQVRPTFDEKPETGATVMVAVPTWALDSTSEPVEDDKVKLGVADTRS
jgi:hypothetical protein